MPMKHDQQSFAAHGSDWSLSWFLSATSLFCCAGCGQDASIAPVSGMVTLNGQPLGGAIITTQPIAADARKDPGSGSFALTDEQGRFALELVKPALPGAIIGEHRVMITPAGDGKPPSVEGSSTDDPHAHLQEAKKRWPAQFSDGSLRLQVPAEGTTTAQFDLKR